MLLHPVLPASKFLASPDSSPLLRLLLYTLL
jgi:hypothetical protein